MRLWSASLALVLAPALALAAGCATSAPAPHDHGSPPAPVTGPVGLSREAAIVAADGAEIGRAVLTEGPRGVLIRLNLNAGALTPGWHGVHFHQIGTCADSGAGFTASGPHVRHLPAGVHGLLNAEGPDAGDLPSLYAPAAGAFGFEAFSTFVTLAPAPVGERMALADADGAALVIHANADDQTTQPIGGAGPRVACAAFSASAG
ncbi:MAG: superoxide dismutase family protein [Hyphomonadaceae bacterium]|nr:superoxide dismutase family protein [Hyphomonadaceae bacterium]